MKVRFFTRKIACAGLAVLLGAVTATAQQPRKDSLLNGLKVVMFANNTSDKVWARIRIHSGSSFDPQGREGLMKMLANNIFPNEAAKEYFSDDLGGSLEIRTTYDYIEIDASAKPEDLIPMLETLSGAVANPVIDKETTAKLRDSMVARVKLLESDPAYVADRAAAKRLFGTFPYGRPIDGGEESIKKIDFVDLSDARAKFLTADNATLVLSGNFAQARALQAVKRFFGAWQKSDKRVPSTFRQPEDPPVGTLTVASPAGDKFEVRVALRGTARSAADMAAADVFARVIEGRLKARVPAAVSSGVSARSEAHLLPGSIVIAFSGTKNDIGSANGKIELNELIPQVLAEPVTDAEFSAARSTAAAEWAKRATEAFWLDADTYGLDMRADREAYATVTAGKVRDFAVWALRQSTVTVLVNSSK